MEDFGSHKHVSYSFRLLFAPEKLRLDKSENMVIMADQNPLFSEFDANKKNELDLVANPSLLQINSPNHNWKGQHVLYLDGRVIFNDARHLQVGSDLDDIFTIKNTKCYRGVERPQPGDIFIAP